jgi:hypothetical protein
MVRRVPGIMSFRWAAKVNLIVFEHLYMLKLHDEFTGKHVCQGQRGGLGLISLQ